MNFRSTLLKPFGLLIEPVNRNDDIRKINVNIITNLLASEHLIIFRGFKTFVGPEEFPDYCEKLGEISMWPFGKVLELIQHDNPKDHIFDNNYVPMHWGGMYRKQVPATQVFHCASAPGIKIKGGTTFVNTKIILENLPEYVKEPLSKITCTYSRKMEFYDSKTKAPIIVKHPDRDYSVIRYCEPPNNNDGSFLNHHGFEINGIPSEAKEDFIKSLNKILYSGKTLYTHQWKTGDVVFSDNHTLLHGREAFAKKAPRHIRRVHLLGKNQTDNPHLIYTK